VERERRERDRERERVRICVSVICIDLSQELVGVHDVGETQYS